MACWIVGNEEKQNKRAHLLIIPDAFVEESELTTLEYEADNKDKHRQQEWVNTTKTKQAGLG